MESAFFWRQKHKFKPEFVQLHLYSAIQCILWFNTLHPSSCLSRVVQNICCYRLSIPQIMWPASSTSICWRWLYLLSVHLSFLGCGLLCGLSEQGPAEIILVFLDFRWIISFDSSFGSADDIIVCLFGRLFLIACHFRKIVRLLCQTKLI